MIVVCSIHQPATKTFELFSKVIVLSQGRTCYNGPVFALPHYLHEIGLPIPELTNPAEYVLDLVNLDFAGADKETQKLQKIFNAWDASAQKQALEQMLTSLVTQPLALDAAPRGPSQLSQIGTLLHRAFIKSYRDLVAYWIRVVMYLGLAVMMGTVWLRLGTNQDNIQPFINAIVSTEMTSDGEIRADTLKVLRFGLHVLHGRGIRAGLPGGPRNFHKRASQRAVWADSVHHLQFCHRPTVSL